MLDSGDIPTKNTHVPKKRLLLTSTYINTLYEIVALEVLLEIIFI